MDRISRQNTLTDRYSCGGADRGATRAAALTLLLGLAVNVFFGAAVSAQDDSSSARSGTSTVPVPPARPSTLVVPEGPVVAAPLQAPNGLSTPTAPEPPGATAPPQAPETKVSGETSAPPWTPGKLLALPPYTRARMHECAVEWQNMKANGSAAEKIWYIFAQSCLVQR